MREHAWEDLGKSRRPNDGDQHVWECRWCGASETSFDEPWWDEIQGGVVTITIPECGGGPANTKVRADCEEELVRQVMVS